MISHQQLRELVIIPALKGLDLYSSEDEEMLISIAAQESHDGFWLKQTVGGSKAALGIFQMQKDTHDNIWDHLIAHDYNLADKLLTICDYHYRPKADVMVYNLLYAACMARLFWVHLKVSLAGVNTIDARWELYKKYWNTPAGKATKGDFLANYNRYVKGSES